VKPQQFVLLAGSLALVALLLLVAVQPANQSGNVAVSSPRFLSALGEGAVVVRPDQAELRFGIWQWGPSAVEAEALARASADQVVAALKSAGVDADAISVSEAVVSAETQPSSGSTTIAGFTATREIRVVLRNLNRLQAVTEAALAAGATSRAAPVYSLQNPEHSRQAAIKAALEDARRQAEALARAGGVSLGEMHGLEVLEESGETCSTPSGCRFRARVRVTFAY